MNSYKLNFAPPSIEAPRPRLGGGAYIENLIPWPCSPEGEELTLIASFPTNFLNLYASCALPTDLLISVFSYFSPIAYFLDCITYPGVRDELECLRKGYTRVILHARGAEVFGGASIPALDISIDRSHSGNQSIGGSKIGGLPDLLQAEPIDLGSQRFVLQLYGADFPLRCKGIFGLSDAVGYLFIDANPSD